MRSCSILLAAVVLAACSNQSSTPISTNAVISTATQPEATLAPTRPAPTDTPALPILTPTTANEAGSTPVVESSPTADPAASVILAYLQARAAVNMGNTLALSCANWQSGAATEVTSFASMNAKLDGVSCSVTGADGGFTLVSCSGEMVTNYGGESRVWDMSRFVYKVTEEAGQWKMCGYH